MGHYEQNNGRLVTSHPKSHLMTKAFFLILSMGRMFTPAATEGNVINMPPPQSLNHTKILRSTLKLFSGSVPC